MLDPAIKKAFLDELVKIGEDAEQKQQEPAWKRVGKSIAAGSLGAGLGYGTALAIEKALGHTASSPSPRKILAAKIGLGLLGAGSVMLADRYRKLMDQTYEETPGWKKDS